MAIFANCERKQMNSGAVRIDVPVLLIEVVVEAAKHYVRINPKVFGYSFTVNWDVYL